MNKSLIKKIIPYVVAVVAFLAISMIYFRPALEGKVLQQSDIIHYKGTVQEIDAYRAKFGEEPLWTNSIFGGMPAYQISTLHPGNFMPWLFKAFYLYVLPHPISILMVLLLGFFLLLLSLKVDPWLGIVGALAFGFSSYFFLFLEVGHNAKALAIAFMPMVLAALVLVFKKKYILGGALLTLFMAFEISVNHVQMTYYLLFVLGIYGLAEGIAALMKKQYVHVLKVIGISIIALLIAIGPSISNLWTSQEYMKESIRGGAELTNNNPNKTSGLDKDYITQWSYGKGETFTLLIPDAKGGASEPIGKGNPALDDVDRSVKGIVAQWTSYWGDLQFTGGPVYVGALICFLFVLGLMIVRGPVKWALLSITLLAMFLAWGHNLAWLTDFFIYYVPFYNKFRAVSSMMIIVELTVPILAILAVKELVENLDEYRKKAWPIYTAFGITGGIVLLFWLTPTTFFDFINGSDYTKFDQYLAGTPEEQKNIFFDGLETARIAIFKASAIRSFLFIFLGAAVLFLYVRLKKMSKYIVYAALGLLILIDLWAIDKRYLNDKDFVASRKMEAPYPKSKANEMILQDKEPDYRVLDLTVGNFTLDASVSYFHKSIGGYHAAKLRRYQDLIEHRLFAEDQALKVALSNKPTDSSIMATLASMSSMNMLNTKYYIYNPEAPPIVNPFALGNAWFVSNVKSVNNADEEIAALNQFDPRNTAVVDKRFADQVSGFKGARDSASRIVLREYEPNKLTYDVSGLKEPQLAVFSEIYYDKGWKAFVDGKEAPYFRANYALRAMMIPAGNHTVVFSFEPKSYYTGTTLSYFGSLLVILVVLAALTWEYLRWKKKKSAKGVDVSAKSEEPAK